MLNVAVINFKIREKRASHFALRAALDRRVHFTALLKTCHHVSSKKKVYGFAKVIKTFFGPCTVFVKG